MDETPANAWQTSSIELMPQRIEALHAGHLLVGSQHAVVVREAGQPDVYYFPRDAVDMAMLSPTEYRTTSQFGEARYWTFTRDRQVHENGAWSYERPAKGAEELADMIAFSPDIVDIHAVDQEGDTMWKREAERMGEYIRHTDSGAGSSQQEHWPPTVGLPHD